MQNIWVKLKTASSISHNEQRIWATTEDKTVSQQVDAELHKILMNTIWTEQLTLKYHERWND